MLKEISLSQRIELEAETRMTYWWPKVQDVDVPMPRTEILKFDCKTLYNLIYPENETDITEANRVIEVVKDAARAFGYPLFMRTDQASGKHDWKHSCFVASEEALPLCLGGLIEANEFNDLNPEAIVIRQYIPLESAFTAFWSDMPVAKERRYFAEDGQVLYHCPYWPEDAIRFRVGQEPPNWREKLADLNRETPEEVELLSGYAARLSAVLPGYWSLDFAKGIDGVWYFIDAAHGEISWYPECSQG